jgi:hypothetical protein
VGRCAAGVTQRLISSAFVRNDIASIVHGVGHVGFHQRQRAGLTFASLFAALAFFARFATCTRDARLAPLAGRALRTDIAALAWIALLPVDAGNSGFSLWPDGTSLATLARWPRWDLAKLGVDELLNLLAQLVLPMTDRCTDHFSLKIPFGLKDLRDVSFEILAPARHFIIRQISVTLLLWRVRFRDAALKFFEAALDLGLQRRWASYVGCVRRDFPAV